MIYINKGILPRGPHPNPLRKLGSEVNEIVRQKVNDLPKVELHNANTDLLQPDGSLSQKDTLDYLHPSELGYRKIFNPIFERLETIIKN